MTRCGMDQGSASCSPTNAASGPDVRLLGRQAAVVGADVAIAAAGNDQVAAQAIARDRCDARLGRRAQVLKQSEARKNRARQWLPDGARSGLGEDRPVSTARAPRPTRGSRACRPRRSGFRGAVANPSPDPSRSLCTGVHRAGAGLGQGQGRERGRVGVSACMTFCFPRSHPAPNPTPPTRPTPTPLFISLPRLPTSMSLRARHAVTCPPR